MLATKQLASHHLSIDELITELESRLDDRVHLLRIAVELVLHLHFVDAVTRSIERRGGAGEVPRGGAAALLEATITELIAEEDGARRLALARELRRLFAVQCAYERTEILPRMTAFYTSTELDGLGRTLDRLRTTRATALGAAREDTEGQDP